MKIFQFALAIAIVSTHFVSAGAERPNMLIVLVDDHAFEAISAYNSYLKDHIQTPSIDRVANEGMRFDNMTVSTSICSPCRASLLTGQHGHVNGVRTLNGGINETSPQYPVQLQKAGYQTWLVGKWHLGSAPKGYDKHMVVKGQGHYFDPTFYGSEGTWKRKGYSTDVYTDIALEWLKDRDRNKPFLLSLQYKAPHAQYDYPDRYNDLHAGVSLPEPPSLYEDIANCNSILKKEMLRTRKFHMLHAQNGDPYYQKHRNSKAPNKMFDHDESDDRDKIRVAYQHLIHKYARCVKGNDDNLKRVIEYLESEGLFDDTVVVYLSDQGYWLGQHGFFDKRLILESSMRTPFMIRYPKLIKPGSVNTDLCVNIDIAPTLLEIAGLEIPAAMQGRSMLSLLRGEKISEGRDAQWYSYWSNPNHHGIRTERYTYIKVPGHDVELYDRKIDPDQFNNIAANPENVEILKNLEKQLQVKITEVGITEDQLPKPNPTTEEINSRNDKKEKDKRSKETNEEGKLVTPKQKAIKRATRRAKKVEQAKEDQS